MARIVLLTLLFGFAWAGIPKIWLEDGVPQQKIIQGDNVNEGEFPFMVSLRSKISSPGHTCGGSILTSKWVLTAAHCCAGIRNVENWYLYAGSIYLSRGGSNHSIEKIFIHENYKPNINWRNDICLIEVSKTFNFGKNVQQITLAPSNWPVNNGSKVTVSGWGCIDPAGIIPDRLQKGVNFIALSNEECRKYCGSEIFDGYLCACGTRNEQCTWNGDSGGPLTLNGAQVGLVSWGFLPYGTGKPTVYSRTTFFVDWIKKKLGPEASKLKFTK